MYVRRPRLRAGWIALILSVAIYAAVYLLVSRPFFDNASPLRSFDLRVYHLGALRLLHGGPLYGRSMIDQAGFTYPPFAAVVMAPLGWLPFAVDKLGVAALNLALLVFVIRRALMLAPEPYSHYGWSVSAALAAGCLWLEPVNVTLGLGQVNLLIAALVLFDLSRPEGARGKGIALGIAAAIKLTPLVFIPYLLFSHRSRTALTATNAFLTSIVLSFLLMPADAAAYWFHAIVQTGRVGNALDVHDQSLCGMIARLEGSAHPGIGWGLPVLAVGIIGLLLAIRAGRRHDEAAGYSLAALTSLLVCPVSWAHHWTLVVPALILLACRAHARRSRGLAVGAALLVALAVVYLPELAQHRFSTLHGPLSILVTSPYPLAGVGVLVVVGLSTVPAPYRQRAFARRERSASPRRVRPTRPRRLAAGV